MKILRDFFAGLLYLAAFSMLMLISGVGIYFVLKFIFGHYFDSEARIFIGTAGGFFFAALCIVGWQTISRNEASEQ